MSTRPPARSAGFAESSDAALLARHVEGDPEAFAVLAGRHQDRLWAVAVRTLGDREEAADAVQDALVKAFRKAKDFRGEAAVTTWLHRIVVNACLDRLRARASRPADPLPETDHAASVAEPVDTLTRRERELDVRAALAKIPTEQRAALVLVDMLGYSVEDAAAILDCAPGTVKSRCARGRARLLPLLSDYSAARGPASPLAGSTDPGAGNPPAPASVQPSTPRSSDRAPTPRRPAAGGPPRAAREPPRSSRNGPDGHPSGLEGGAQT